MSQHKEEATFEAVNRQPSGVAKWAVRIITATILLLAVNQAFNFRFFIGFTLIDLQFFYVILGIALAACFLVYPARGASWQNATWVDWTLSLLSLVCCSYFVGNAYNISLRGWEMIPPRTAVYFAFLLWALVIEGARRSGGNTLAAVVLLLSLYPVYTEYMPHAIAGFASPIDLTAAYHAMGSESMMGIPIQVFAKLIVGFIVFGAALKHTGAGSFFLNISFALLGKVRGGPAKVAIFSSGLMGSMSGSVITNVLTTGTLTIPAMRRIGIKPAVAAGIETCASTGGVLMPPVMGATAFVMASFMNVPYGDVALAAVIPSALYFFGLFVQIDGLAARDNIKGLPQNELPGLIQSLKEGWYYIFAFALLIYMLLVMRNEALAPFYTTPVLILLNQLFSKKHRWGKRELGEFFDTLGSIFSNLVVVLAGVGMVIGALSVTGVAATVVNDLLKLADGNTLMLLFMGALTSLILGLGLTSTAAYIFLAILLAPALVKVGLDPMAVHMFIFYYGMLSFITPPVALGAFAAASIAQTPPMRTGLEAMRLGSVIYFIPFFFVFNPALVLQGTVGEIILATSYAAVGIALFAYAMQGYLPFVGPLFQDRWYGPLLRVALLLGAFVIALPANVIPGWSETDLLMLAISIAIPIIGAAVFQNRFADRQTDSSW